LRVGVVGCGVGKGHIEGYKALPDRFEVLAVCDIDETKAHNVAAQFGIPRVSREFADLCRMDDLDAIDLCTPSYLHYAQTLEVLAAGKNVICEKPVAASLKEVDDLIAAEAQSDNWVMPIFQYRFGHGIQKLKLLTEAGIAGRAYLTTSETAWRRRPEYYAVPWRGKWATEIGGPMVTLAIHAHDAICYVLGPVKSIFARTATLVNPIETEDCVAASLQMADGSLCSLSVTTGSAQQISRLRFCFSNLSAESNLEPYNHTADPWIFTGDSPEVTQRIEAALSRYEALPLRFAGQFYHLHQALNDKTGNTPMPVTLADSRASLELITATYYSARTGQAVDLPLPIDHPFYASWCP
jgi:predicted dehydrogenase